ncbi:MAG: PaaI family thioesterase [Hydrogenophilaceae bacterium]|jgi:uncharacterized protein (TIGR00369 family)|nr:PaaI family thioesterase [Hydrogenophilaceae bacterium]
MSKDASPPPDIDVILARLPYARFLGVRAEAHGDELTLVMPFKPPLIGNPSLPALHGGAVGAFMELTAFAQLSVAARLTRLPKTIDITIDYLRSGKPVDAFARARMVRVGRRIANVHVEAWQNERAAPIAALHGNFLVTEER